MKKILFLFTFFCISAMLYSESFIITTERLNIRKTDDKYSEVVGKLKKNDIIQGNNLNNGWIKLDNNEGYINSEYATITASTENKKISHPFWYTFKNSFGIILLIVAVLFGMMYAGKNTKKDKRYKFGMNKENYERKQSVASIVGLLVGVPVAIVIDIIYSAIKYFGW